MFYGDQLNFASVSSHHCKSRASSSRNKVGNPLYLFSASVRILLHADPVSSVHVARPSLARLTPPAFGAEPKENPLWRKLSGLNLSEAGVSEPRPPIFLLPSSL